MKQQNIIWNIADSLRGSGEVKDYPGEISLLVAFCNMHPNYQSNTLPTPAQVIDGTLSLKKAYQGIAASMPEESAFLAIAYKNAKLPSVISERKAIEYLESIIAVGATGNSWLVHLQSQFANDKFSGLNTLPDELVKLLTALSHQGEEIESAYTPFPGSAQLAAEMKTYSNRVDFESIAMPPIAVATILTAGHSGA